MHILLVDDNDEFRALTAQLLGRAGHAVRTAGSAAEAMRLLRAAPADLVMTNIVMPKEDGFELLTKVRQQFPDVATIGMTGASAHASLYLEIASRLGAGATLLKPFSGDELLLAVARVELARATRNRTRKPWPPAASP